MGRCWQHCWEGRGRERKATPKWTQEPCVNHLKGHPRWKTSPAPAVLHLLQLRTMGSGFGRWHTPVCLDRPCLEKVLGAPCFVPPGPRAISFKGAPPSLSQLWEFYPRPVPQQVPPVPRGFAGALPPDRAGLCLWRAICSHRGDPRSDPNPVGRDAASGETEIPAVPKLLALLPMSYYSWACTWPCLFFSALYPYFLLSLSILPYNRNTTRGISSRQ